MSHFPPRPLGTRIPDLPHAVSCSLPTMGDLIGYEEKDAATLGHITSGYPRFVVHPMLVAVAHAWRRRENLGDTPVWMVSSRRMAERLAAHLAPECSKILAHDGLTGLVHRDDPGLRKRARAFLQHVGGLLSSREAEDYAVRNGFAAATAPEPEFAGDAGAEVRRVLGAILGFATPEEILLAPSGMNAFWAAFHALGAGARAAGRDTWLQVGWLYLDTAAILAEFTGGRLIRVLDVHDRGALEAAFHAHGPRLAAVVTEVPTNPLIQTCDLAWLAGRARAHGAFMVADPSIASPFNVDVLPHADVVINSLTKYAACDGDVIAGAVVVTPRCPDAAAVRAAIAAELEPAYPRDLARLACEIGHYAEFVAQLDATTRTVVAHLQERRGVRRLHWSLQEGSRKAYLALARAPDRIAPVLSFEVEGPVERFYDATPLAKGPSFGMRTTLLCPFVYLAHYDLVTNADGRRLLAEANLPPQLLRLAIGEEPAEAIIEALEIGFAAAGF